MKSAIISYLLGFAFNAYTAIFYTVGAIQVMGPVWGWITCVPVYMICITGPLIVLVNNIKKEAKE